MLYREKQLFVVLKALFPCDHLLLVNRIPYVCEGKVTFKCSLGSAFHDVFLGAVGGKGGECFTIQIGA